MKTDATDRSETMTNTTLTTSEKIKALEQSVVHWTLAGEYAQAIRCLDEIVALDANR